MVGWQAGGVVGDEGVEVMTVDFSFKVKLIEELEEVVGEVGDAVEDDGELLDIADKEPLETTDAKLVEPIEPIERVELTLIGRPYFTSPSPLPAP
ncbi:hypothetical protein HYALB_00002143 [Hymenoscyphus albidus]|uniref:Uncharacterized protein n=1 Tax=Hymenoscyphus albidus TaxID=595503 RepID=A0A9N9LQ95_9HELO|nr:hypothetical protein HYALB_00002143 [Hymenoscyphus albidus]